MGRGRDRPGGRHQRPRATDKRRYVIRGACLFESTLKLLRPPGYTDTGIEDSMNALASTVSEGYSGARFWMDRRTGYAMKSIGYLEFNTLRRTVGAYAAHCLRPRGKGEPTVLASVYAVYSVRDNRTGGTLRVLVTNALIPPDDTGVHPFLFDLKGSRRPGRRVRGCGDDEGDDDGAGGPNSTARAKARAPTTRKERDLCLSWDPRTGGRDGDPPFVCANAIGLSARNRGRLLRALERDTAYLESQMLMDYSLLVVFDTKSVRAAKGAARALGARPTMRRGGVRFPVLRAPPCLPGARSVVVGIIDTSTYYGVLKRAEALVRTAGRPGDDRARASPVHPSAYRTRMLRFLRGVFPPSPPSPPRVGQGRGDTTRVKKKRKMM